MPFELYPTVLYVHYLGIAILLAGALVALISPGVKLRQRAAYFVAAPGFLMAWGGGHAMSEFIDRDLFDPVNVLGFLLLTVLMNVAHRRAARGESGDAGGSPQSGWFTLRNFGYIEGASLLVLLFLAMPLKYIGDIDTAVRYVGMIHGGLFMVFVGWVAIAARRGGWTIEKVAGALAASIIPFGPYVADLTE